MKGFWGASSFVGAIGGPIEGPLRVLGCAGSAVRTQAVQLMS